MTIHMTDTNKSVRRVTVGTYPFRGGQRRSVVVTITPGDVLTFRFKGTRKSFDYPIYSAALLAIQATVRAEKLARREARAGR